MPSKTPSGFFSVNPPETPTGIPPEGTFLQMPIKILPDVHSGILPDVVK